MQIIGLTGIIGSGKSTVAEIIRRHYKSIVIDVDRIGHQLLAKDPQVMEKVVRTFGTNKRPLLAQIVFRNPAKLKALNKITHPALRQRVAQIIRQNSSEKFIVIDAALLFTIGLHRYCKEIIFVAATPEMIQKRLEKKGLTSDEILLRLTANQKVLSLKKKCRYLIENNGTRLALAKKVRSILNKITS